MDWVAVGIAVLALIVSGVAAWYTSAQAREAKRSNDDQERARVREEITLAITGSYPHGLTFSVTSRFPHVLRDIRVSIAPAGHDFIGFIPDAAEYASLLPRWRWSTLSPGERASAPFADLRPIRPPQDFLVTVTFVQGRRPREYAWVESVEFPYDPLQNIFGGSAAE